MRRRPLYVETVIDTDLDQLWEKSQDPSLHQRWDLRFSEIGYLPRDPDGPQRFVYASRVAGFRVDGTGESTGKRFRPDGASSSFLKFWSDHPLALIKEGSGFWRYEPADRGVRFYTGYDYRVRWGWLGRVIDRFVFRPWIGWATAWSFDRLRLWLEKGIPPESTLTSSLAHLAARAGLAAVWIYQGLVPKLLVPAGEVALATSTGITDSEPVVAATGVVQIAFGLVFLLAPRWRWPYLLTAALMVPLTLVVLWSNPSTFTEPFNPFALNVTVVALGVVGYLTWPDRPSARHCQRKPSRDDDVDL